MYDDRSGIYRTAQPSVKSLNCDHPEYPQRLHKTKDERMRITYSRYLYIVNKTSVIQEKDRVNIR